jgi:hypothetical protein
MNFCTACSFDGLCFSSGSHRMATFGWPAFERDARGSLCVMNALAASTRKARC